MASGKSVYRPENLSFKERLAEVTVNMEEYNGSVSSTDCYFVVGYWDYAFDSLSANILSENEELVLYLEAAEISR